MNTIKTASTTGDTINGLQWTMHISGRKCVYSVTYTVTIGGVIEATDKGNTIYDILHSLADVVKKENKDMELPERLVLALWRPEDVNK